MYTYVYVYQDYVSTPGQPGQQMMAMPEGVVGCPPGLEYLTQLDQLVVKQQVELLEGLVATD